MFVGQEMHHYMVYIAYHSEINLQICNYAQNDAFVVKIANTRLKKICMPIFALAERLPTSATLLNNRNCSVAKILKVYSSNNDADQGKGASDDKWMRKLHY